VGRTWIKAKLLARKGPLGTSCVSRHIGSGYLASCFNEGGVQSTVGSRLHGRYQDAWDTWRRWNRSPYITAGAVPGGVAVATAPNAASRVEKVMRHHLIGPDSRSISKSLTSLTLMSGEHMAASPLVVVSEWEWNQAPSSSENLVLCCKSIIILKLITGTTSTSSSILLKRKSKWVTCGASS
jgi:hypothetical protein